MAGRGLKGILLIGNPNSPLLEIQVGIDRAGMVIVGGLNPVAAVEDAGIPTAVAARTAVAAIARGRRIADRCAAVAARAARTARLTGAPVAAPRVSVKPTKNPLLESPEAKLDRSRASESQALDIHIEALGSSSLSPRISAPAAPPASRPFVPGPMRVPDRKF